MLGYLSTKNLMSLFFRNLEQFNSKCRLTTLALAVLPNLGYDPPSVGERLTALER
jgi:hypothetical protein